MNAVLQRCEHRSAELAVALDSIARRCDRLVLEELDADAVPLRAADFESMALELSRLSVRAAELGGALSLLASVHAEQKPAPAKRGRRGR